MAKIERSIELEVPVRSAYQQMTQFAEYPKFMSHLREVRQLDDTHLHWRAEFGGKDIEWDAEIAEQVPDQRIAWRSTHGSRNSGEISFASLADNRSRLTLKIDVPGTDSGAEGQKTAKELGARAEADLQGFKRFIENRSQQGERDTAAGGEAPQGSRAAQGANGGSTHDQAGQTGEDFVRATHAAVEQANRFGKSAVQAASQNINRFGRQAEDLAARALQTQRSLQASAVSAANAAMRPFGIQRSLQPQAWWSAMFDALEQPLSMMRRFSEEMQNELESMMYRSSDLLGRELTAMQAWTPNVDVAQHNDQLVISADLPGIRKEDLQVEIDNGQLVIRGERRAQHESIDQGQKRVECSYGSFTRYVPLPDDVDVSKVEASVADGVLSIKVPNPSSRQPTQRIEVRSRDDQDRRQQTAEAAPPSAERRRTMAKSSQPSQRSAA